LATACATLPHKTLIPRRKARFIVSGQVDLQLGLPKQVRATTGSDTQTENINAHCIDQRQETEMTSTATAS